MKQRVCPNCGFRNFTDYPRCSRCNELLLPESGYRSAPPIPITSTKPLTPTVYSSTTSSPPAPIPKPSSSTPVPYTPFPTSVPTPIHSTVPTVYPPNPLPTHFKKLPPPVVEGEVVDTGQHQNENKGLTAGDILHYGVSTVLLVTEPLYGLMSLVSGARRPKEYKSIYTFRVKTPNNDIVEARIERDIVGATISLGDYVSIWGQMSGGVVIVNHAYNHTVKGEVRLR